jgi:hypothetical protein
MRGMRMNSFAASTFHIVERRDVTPKEIGDSAS